MPNIYTWLRSALLKLGYELPRDEQRLAQAILKLSEFYQRRNSSPEIQVTPWRDAETQAAYLAYFFPLNWLRIQRCLQQIPPSFWQGVQNVVDVGSGPGNFQLALKSHAPSFHGPYFAVETSTAAYQLHLDLAREFHLQLPQRTQRPFVQPSTLVVLSYSLNELGALPEWAISADRILILEPSVMAQSRSLMSLRQTLLERGYNVVAPCTHREGCPLLLRSKTDFCHDRFFIELPDWLEQLHRHLPMQNRSLTLSYLVVSKSHDGLIGHDRQGRARVIGDTLFEAGKVRQAICRNDRREFISVLRKQIAEFAGFPHGALIELPDSLVLKGNELRLDAPTLAKIATVDPGKPDAPETH
jgi:hypothetical protein